MKDTFKKAILLEKKYRKLRLKRNEKNAFNYIQKLKNLNYTQKELEEDKIIDFIAATNFIIEEVELDSFTKSVEEAKLNTLLIVKPQETSLCLGKQKDIIYNKEYCKKNNIAVHHIDTPGSTSISGKEDLILAFIVDNINLRLFLFKKIGDWIKANSSTEDINEYEIIRSTSTRKKSIFINYYVVYFKIDKVIHDNITKGEGDCMNIKKSIGNFTTKSRETLIKTIKTWL